MPRAFLEPNGILILVLFVAALNSCLPHENPTAPGAAPQEAATLPADNTPDTATAQSLYNYLAGKAIGDLDKDGIADSVTVQQDTTDNTHPYRLQVFFGHADGTYTSVVTADHVIEATYPLGSDGMNEGHRFDEVVIKKGTLDIHTSLIHSNVHHIFRYQHGHFELIGFSQDQLEDINTVSEEQYNLSTGQYIRYKEAPDGTGKSEVENRVIPVSPLPVLDNFVPFTSKGEITY
ncbi:hypothetical protein [Chitinophaga arvensicola]|uniref:Uncharacterized protein n=1 Tax=Chitinophaga arvensicola TaxID=29529 RepID=A0A1I0S9J6_9BACT|nr:hypothetical protein [Chitinophaga arvensicola]SEW52853.1 hypothetical protein SAMN04488122_5179 [Chitinophaga arvensicola]